MFPLTVKKNKKCRFCGSSVVSITISTHLQGWICFEEPSNTAWGSTGCHEERNTCLNLKKLINVNADSWVSPLHWSNPKLFRFPHLNSSHILRLMALLTGLLSRGHCSKQRRNKTPLFFLSFYLFFSLARFSLLFICLKDCQSQESLLRINTAAFEQL